METYYSFFKSQLKQLCNTSELHDFVFLIGRKLTGLSDVEIMTKDCSLSDYQTEMFEQYLKELLKNRPIQYVLGETEFCGLKLKVDERVLIPRPETAELVNFVIETAKASCRILDIGTGSGCIAIALSKLISNAEIVAYDISESALELATENARLNGANILFREIDILNPPNLLDKFDVIVSNPPYIMFSEQKEMCSNVIDYEPHTALFVPDNNPLIFYRAIIYFAKNHLNSKGCLYFEINRTFSQQISELLDKAGFLQVECRKDMFDNDRMIKAVWQ